MVMLPWRQVCSSSSVWERRNEKGIPMAKVFPAEVERGQGPPVYSITVCNGAIDPLAPPYTDRLHAQAWADGALAAIAGLNA